ncbi:MAG TPA: hypothetical protein VJ783_08685 [Pirellulales bacterium]|nr:hypothetical protein [Pirellulales bacterium]
MSQNRLILIIMAAVVAWGGFLALGNYLAGHNWRGPAMVMGCVVAFLVFWGLMLASRRRRG